jgi:hypothetical protein
VNTSNNLIHFFSCLAEAPIAPVGEFINEKMVKPEKKLTEEEIMMLKFKEQ